MQISVSFTDFSQLYRVQSALQISVSIVDFSQLYRLELALQTLVSIVDLASFTHVITDLSITYFCQHYRLITQGGAMQLLDFPREESNSKRVNYAKYIQTILRRGS